MESENISQVDLLASVTPENASGSFGKHWDSGTRHEPPVQTDLANHHQTILNLLVETRESQNQGWLGDLAQQVEHINKETPSKPVEPETYGRRTILKLMNKIFDDFELFSTQFNETNSGSELFINCSRPETRRPSSELAGDGTMLPLYMDGYLATRNWSLLLRGTRNKIKVFVFPSEVLLGFRSSTVGESDFPPLFEIARAKDQNRRGWKIGDKWISHDQLPILSAQLFSDFVRLAATPPAYADIPAQTATESMEIEPPPSASAANDAPATDQIQSNELPKQVLLDPAVLEACKVISIVVDQNLHRLLQQSKHSIETKQFDQFYDIQQLIEKLGALKSFVGTTSEQIAPANR
ncbi:MAG: hypothetical protein C5B53_08850 [Candidatus Melainabacteria bacterium]|nr:MAG: hypothetical protein C5B53_08850 [Candidatus Melainabacteria bacterium]